MAKYSDQHNRASMNDVKTNHWSGLQNLEARILLSATLSGTGGETTPIQNENGHMTACGCCGCSAGVPDALEIEAVLNGDAEGWIQVDGTNNVWALEANQRLQVDGYGNVVFAEAPLNAIEEEPQTDIIDGAMLTVSTDGTIGEENPGDVVDSAAPYALDDTFKLHSLAGASHTIYLDFDGHTTSGTSWNSSYNGNADIVTPAYSYEGDASFSDAEKERIQKIWERVAEDFRPFNVNVTTEDPGTAALINSGGADTEWGIRVVIGGESDDWYTDPAVANDEAGGVAYLTSFNYSTDTPTYVFEDNLANGAEKSVAEAISHEVGHTLGLSHDGLGTGDSDDGPGNLGYYTGHGSGATGWAPIMGVGYNRELTQWSKGEYTNASNTQDDLSIITSNNGFGYRTDDHGNANGAATFLTGTTSLTGNGIIEQNTDVDVFGFQHGGGSVSLSIDPFYRSPNLDIKASLYDSSGTLIATDGVNDGVLDADFSLSLSQGTYYLHIEGTGDDGTSNGSEGYSDYGSLGYYSITGTVTDPGGDITNPGASVTASNVIGTGSSTYDFTVTYSDNVGVDVSTLGTGDLLVTGPNGFSQTATFVSVDVNSDGTPRTATYRINTPGGSWDSAEWGTYEIAMQSGQVQDTNGNAVAAGNIGSFAVTGTIYSENFESGTLDGSWSTSSTNTGRIEVTTTKSPRDSYQLFMDSSATNSFSLNQAVWTVDLEDYENVSLSFWWQDTNDELHDQDNVEISVDGGNNWTRVVTLATQANNGWTQELIDLDALGLTYANNTMIRFQQYDNWTATSDGIGFDDIVISGNQVDTSFSVVGSTLTVTGTSGADTFSATAGASSISVTLNGDTNVYNYSSIDTIIFNGEGGTDSATITLGSHVDTVNLYANTLSGQVSNNVYNLTLDSTENIQITGQLSDTVLLYDSSGNDTFNTYNQSGITTLLAGGSNYTTQSFGTVRGYSNNGGLDKSYHYDSSGNDTFLAYNDQGYARMVGNGLEYSAYNFAESRGYSNNGGSDKAYHYDSSGNDVFLSYNDQGYTRMVGNGLTYSAYDFSISRGYSRYGGSDKAYQYDSSGNDTFYTYQDSGYTRMNGNGYDFRAHDFSISRGYSRYGGSDQAYQYDSSGDDNYYSYQDSGYSRMSGNGFDFRAHDFSNTRGYSNNGGVDTARQYDSSGNDIYRTYNGQGYTRMNGNGFEYRAYNFDNTYGYSNNGGDDTAYQYDSSVNDIYRTYNDLSYTRMTGNGLEYRAYDFETTRGYSNNGGLDKSYHYDSSGNDTFLAYNDQGYARMVGNGLEYSAYNFAESRGYSNNGGSDKAYHYDSSGNDVFLSYNDQGYTRMVGNGLTYSAYDFSISRGYSRYGGTDKAYQYDSSGNDTFYTYQDSGYTRMNGNGYDFRAHDFSISRGYSRYGGSDQAYQYDSSGDDNYYFYGHNAYSRMSGNGFDFRAHDFSNMRGYSNNGGVDTARHYDGSGNDVFGLYSNYVSISVNSQINRSDNFSDVFNYSQSGGVDSVTNHETPSYNYTNTGF